MAAASLILIPIDFDSEDSRKVKKTWRKYSNTDDLTTQLKTLDKMARSPIGKYGKRRRKKKKKKKKIKHKLKNVYNVHDDDAKFILLLPNM